MDEWDGEGDGDWDGDGDMDDGVENNMREHDETELIILLSFL